MLSEINQSEKTTLECFLSFLEASEKKPRS
jgi:hypothetical protein